MWRPTPPRLPPSLYALTRQGFTNDTGDYVELEIQHGPRGEYHVIAWECEMYGISRRLASRGPGWLIFSGDGAKAHESFGYCCQRFDLDAIKLLAQL